MALNVNDPVAVAARSASDQFHSLLSFWLAAIIYGVYLILLLSSVRITMRLERSQWTFSAKILCSATFVVLVLITIWMGISARRFFYAFSPQWTRVSGGQLPIDYLRTLSTSWDSYTNVVITNILTWLADALIIYRCFIIWDRNICIIIPSCLVLLLSFISCSITLTWFRHPEILTLAQAKPLLDMAYPVSIVQSCLTTSLITFRIWQSYSRPRSTGLYAGGSGSGLLTVIRIIVESAMIFAAQQVTLCILYYIDSPAQHVFHGTMVPSIGVVFILLAMRAYGVTRPGASPNIQWPTINSSARLRTVGTAFTTTVSTCSGHPPRRMRHHRRTASDSFLFTGTAVTLTIPDTNIYSSNPHSAVSGDIERGDVSRENDAGMGGGEKPPQKRG